LFASAGIGEEDATAEDYTKRIKDGIAQMVLDLSFPSTYTLICNEYKINPTWHSKVLGDSLLHYYHAVLSSKE